MSSYIHPENISPTDLSTVVASSDLVSVERLFDAYKTQALRSEKSEVRMPTFYEQCRGAYVWMRSGTNAVVFKTGQDCSSFDVLDCPIMKSGVHKWRIKVLQGKKHALGVVVTCPSDGPSPSIYLPFSGEERRGYCVKEWLYIAWSKTLTTHESFLYPANLRWAPLFPSLWT
jgi:hypothetical protein